MLSLLETLGSPLSPLKNVFSCGQSSRLNVLAFSLYYWVDAFLIGLDGFRLFFKLNI